MATISVVAVAKLIEAHIEHNDRKFMLWANFIADSLTDSGDEFSERVIRSRLDGSYENKEQNVALD